MLIDTHAHLNLPPLYDHWLEVLDQAEAAGVKRVIVPGVTTETSRIAVELSKKDVRIFAAVGIHPESAGEHTNNLKNLALNRRVVAVGECGLDYFRGNENRELQIELFRTHIELAGELKLPLIIHTRTSEAMRDAVTILKKYPLVQLVFHCFSGDLSFWKEIESLGALVGIGGMITYPKNEALRDTVRHIPLERIILETDAPWLPPQPLRGQINTPQNVTIAACKLAEIKEVQLSEVLEITGSNASRLFPFHQS